jgi:ERCC4-related helicase
MNYFPYGYYETLYTQPINFSKLTKTVKSDDVNKPEHYTLARPASDCYSVMKQIGLLTNYPLATAFKYLWRCNNKENYLKDLKKCKWFLEKAIEEYEAKLEAEKGDKTTWTNPYNK